MKISELIEKLNKILKKEKQDVPVVVDIMQYNHVEGNIQEIVDAEYCIINRSSDKKPNCYAVLLKFGREGV